MKKRLFIIVLALAAILAMVISGCTPKPQTATAYGIFHKQYAGKVDITVDSNKNVTAVKFTEYLPLPEIGKLTTSAGSNLTVYTATAYGVFHQQYAGKVTLTVDDLNAVTAVKFYEYLPVSEIGKVTATTVEEVTTYAIGGVEIDSAHLVAVTGTSSTSYYAKWVKVGGEMFTYDTATSAYTGTKIPDGLTLKSGATSAYSDSDFTEWYIGAMDAGNYYVCKDATGTETYDIAYTTYGSYGKTTTKATWANKEANGYWTGTNYPLGWPGNIAAMETAIKAYGLEAYTGTEAKDGTWPLGNNATSATLNDYHQYMAVAKAAYNTVKAGQIYGTTIAKAHTTNGYAKWLKVGGEIFTYDATANAYTNTTKIPTGLNFTSGDTNVYNNAAFTQWYIEAMDAGNYYVCKNATGTETYDIAYTTYGSYGKTTTKATWASKEVNGYWTVNSSGVAYPLGWLGNIAAMETAIKTYGLEGYTGTEKGPNVAVGHVDYAEHWLLGDNATGATLTDYHQYMAVAKAAYDAAVAKF